MNREPHFAEGDNVLAAEFRRWLTNDLMRAIAFDVWPRHKSTREAFGLGTQEHLEALYEPVRHGEITRTQLHDAVGDGKKLSDLVNAAKANPHPGIDFIPEIKEGEAPVKHPAQQRDKDLDRER